MLKYLKSRLTSLCKLCLLIVALKTPWIIYNNPDLPDSSLTLNKQDLMARRKFLMDSIRSEDFGLSYMGLTLPAQFKEEWLIGSLSMTTAAITNLAFEFPETKSEALEDVGFMIERMLEPDIRNFEKRAWSKDALDNLESDDGQIGYLGHLNFMIGAYNVLGGDDRYRELNADISNALARRLENSSSCYLETFPDQIFVPDNMVVYASLSMTDTIDSVRYQNLIQRWKDYTKKYVTDPQSGMLLSWVSTGGEGLGPPRGSYLGFGGYYLAFFAPDMAKEQYEKLKENMIVNLPFGAKAIREYPSNAPGRSDVDSGPVIFGMSTSGTGFNVSSARIHEDADLFKGLLLTAETVGSTIETGGKRRYLLAPFVGEAIMLAMKTARSWKGA